MYTLVCFKWITNKDLLYSTGNSAQCYMAAWNVRESIPRQTDKKFRVPKDEKWVWVFQSDDWGSGILKEKKRTNFLFSSTVLQFSSVVSDSLRPHECSTPGLPVHHQLLEFTQTHAH